METELASAVTWLDWLTLIKRVGGFMVIAGVAIEVGGDWIAGPFQKKVDDARELQLEQLRTAASDANAVAKAAEARAAEANLALEKFRAPRILTPEQHASVVEKIKFLAPTQFDTGLNPDKEELDFLWQLETLLKDAGWVQVDWKNPPGVLFEYTRNGRPAAGLVSVSNVSVQVHKGQERKLLGAAIAISAALNAVGIAAQIDPFNIANNNPDAIHIMVGRKQ